MLCHVGDIFFYLTNLGQDSSRDAEAAPSDVGTDDARVEVSCSLIVPSQCQRRFLTAGEVGRVASLFLLPVGVSCLLNQLRQVLSIVWLVWALRSFPFGFVRSLAVVPLYPKDGAPQSLRTDMTLHVSYLPVGLGDGISQQCELHCLNGGPIPLSV